MYFDQIAWLVKYVSVNYPEPKSTWKSEQIRRRSIELWALERAINACFENREESPKDILEGFIFDMERDIIMNSNPSVKRYFTIAKNALKRASLQLR